MKRCLQCNKEYGSDVFNCPACCYQISKVGAIAAYAPEMAIEGDGFKSSYFSELASVEEASFWFVARNHLILWALRKFCSPFQSFFEIGCGTGFVLKAVAKEFPRAKLFGSEIFTAGLDFAAERVGGSQLMQMDARNIPFVNEFDVIGAFDVLEHIEEDTRVLAQIYQALNPGGYMLITVPQHQCLWSATDEYACHVRRYEAKDLHSKVKAAGFQILKTTSFVSALFPAMLISRLFHKKSTEQVKEATTELKMNPLLNKIFMHIMQLEVSLIKMGISFPIGGSRLVVAKKLPN